MGILLNESDFSDLCKERNINNEPTCFFCGSNIFSDNNLSTGGAVFWGGNDIIFLHQSCAERLGMHLIQDARSLTERVKKIVKWSEREVEDCSYMWHCKS